ncbi:hypothetical protein BJX61DRAFT_540862 [Aspergillus egyptiacus]|nr:hypothetical protein BJX61DRAFT_540862 [Aspergillus egyptiacus]
MGTHRTSSPSRSASPTLHITIVTITTLLILTLLILIIGPSRILSDASSSSSSTCPQISITNDYAQLPPWEKPILRIYNDSMALKNTRRTTQYPSDWETLLMPPGDNGAGVRAIESSLSALDDYPGQKAQNSDNELGIGFGIAMFHQLHCLITIRDLIFRENSVRPNNSYNKAHQQEIEEQNVEHWAHCFDYLAQALICAADDSMERPKKGYLDDGQLWWHIDGVGAVHQCKDARSLWEMVRRSQEKQYDMSRWKEGIGAREYFAEELKDGYRFDIPDVWTLGNIGP